MSNDITINPTQFNTILRGIIMTMKASGIAKNHESFSHAMHDLNMWDFVYNQAQVAAAAHAYNTKLYNIIYNTDKRY